MKLLVVDYCLFYPSTLFANNNSPIIHPSKLQISFAVADVLLPWLIFQQTRCSLCRLRFPAVPHRCPEGSVRERGGDRRHGHAARFPAPAAGRDTPPGGEAQVQQRAGQQELPHPRAARQAQLHRLARRSGGGGVRRLNWQNSQGRVHPPKN